MDTLLLEMLQRGDTFLTDKLTLAQLPSLVFGGAGSALREQFDKQVLQFTTKDIDDHVHGLIEWLIGKNDRKSHAVVEYVMQNSTHASKSGSEQTGSVVGTPMVGNVSVVFDDNRRAALKKMVTQSRDIVRACVCLFRVSCFVFRVSCHAAFCVLPVVVVVLSLVEFVCPPRLACTWSGLVWWWNLELHCRKKCANTRHWYAIQYNTIQYNYIVP